MSTEVYPERIEFVGRPPGSPLPVAIVVTLGVVQEDGFGGRQVTHRGPMDAAEAESLGWPVSRVQRWLSDALMADLAAVRAQVGDLDAAVMAAQRRADDAATALADLKAEHEIACARAADGDGLRAERDALTTRLGLLGAEIAELRARLERYEPPQEVGDGSEGALAG